MNKYYDITEPEVGALRFKTPSQGELQTLHFRYYFHPIAAIPSYKQRVAALAYLAGLAETACMGKFTLGEAEEAMETYCRDHGICIDPSDRRWLEWDEEDSPA